MAQLLLLVRVHQKAPLLPATATATAMQHHHHRWHPPPLLLQQQQKQQQDQQHQPATQQLRAARLALVHGGARVESWGSCLRVSRQRGLLDISPLARCAARGGVHPAA